MKGMLITEKLDEGRMKGNSGEEKYLRPPLDNQHDDLQLERSEFRNRDVAEMAVFADKIFQTTGCFAIQ